MMVGACGDNAPTPDRPGKVVVRTDPAGLGECPYGGSIVRAGIDGNGNQTLDDGEVVTRTVLCNDAPVQPSPPTVVRLRDEPAGEHCAKGGTAVQSGPDRNGNAALDDDEVAHTDYVCGAALRTRFAAEPAGAHCTAGGIAFFVGRDRNGDGSLGDDEIEVTEYECSEILSRSVTVTSKADLATLAHIRVISGSLEIRDLLIDDDGVELDEVALPALEQVDGNLVISGDKLLTRIHMPALHSVGLAALITDNASLKTLELPGLAQVGATLSISRDPELADMAMVGHVARVGGDFVVDDDPALAAIAMPARVVGTIDVSGNDSLTTLDVAVTDRSDQIRIAQNGLQSLSITGGGLDTPQGVLANIQILDNPQLATAAVSADRIGTLVIRGNTFLDRVTLLAAQIDGDVELTGNTRVDSMTVNNPHDLASPVEIAGSFKVSGPLTTLGTESALAIGRDLTLEGTQIVILSRIARVDGKLRLADNATLLGADSAFPLGGGLEVTGNAMLLDLSLLAQDTIDGDVAIVNNASLGSMQAVGLARAIHGSLAIRDNPSLFSTDAGGVQQIDGELTITGNAVLADLQFGVLHSAPSITIEDNASLPEIGLAALSAASDIHIQIRRNDALGHVALPALTQAASVVVEHNHHLPSCEVAAMFEHITAPVLNQVDNDDTATCDLPAR